MWANWEVLEFLDWLAVHNQLLDEDDRIGFFGLDVYSLFESLEAVVDYLEDVDPDAAAEAREAYRCFEPYGEDAQSTPKRSGWSPRPARTRSSIR